MKYHAVIMWRKAPVICLDIDTNNTNIEILDWYAEQGRWERRELTIVFLQKLDNHPFIKSKSKQIESVILTDCVCINKDDLERMLNANLYRWWFRLCSRWW